MQYVAFLRGMNLGGRRVTNEELCEHFAGLGLEKVWAFLASGNVVFESALAPAKLSQRIERGLREALEYDVPTFLRTGSEVAELGAAAPFEDSRGASGGKLQVALLAEQPSAAQRDVALSHATPADQLAIEARTLFWLPAGKLTESELDLRAVGKALGAMTVRTQNTLQRLSKKLAEKS